MLSHQGKYEIRERKKKLEEERNKRKKDEICGRVSTSYLQVTFDRILPNIYERKKEENVRDFMGS